jgi:HD-GYP domain-containing protein (c-di-GMP phosphodiesterase class II)
LLKKQRLRVVIQDVNRERSAGTRPGLSLWLVVFAAFAGILIAGLRGPLADTRIVAPTALFWLVVIGAGLCWFPSVALIVVGWRRGLAEVAILGSALGVESGFGLVHGFTVPGVLYGPNNAVLSSAFIALPAALVAAFPVLTRRSTVGATLGRHWRSWAVTWMGLGTACCGLLLARPDILAAPTIGSPIPVAVGVVSFSTAVALSLRQLRLYWVGRLRASLIVSLAFLWLGLSGLVWLGRGTFSAGFWIAHVLDIGGVAVGAVALLIGYRPDRSVAAVMAPVLTRDPLVALDLGLSPVTHRLIGLLDCKDPISRDHVVRVGELAMRAGERAGLGGTRLRNLGLAALLHDIGKLEIPSEILTKPDALNEEEMAIMRTHAEIGELLLLSEPELAPAARFVRSHHERHDGRGYPDGIGGDQIPVEVGIIGASDAFDAICHTRHYRTGIGPDQALNILRDNAGSQWNSTAAGYVIAAIEAGGAAGTAHDHIGRSSADAEYAEFACGCADALPDRVREFAMAVPTPSTGAEQLTPRS